MMTSSTNRKPKFQKLGVTSWWVLFAYLVIDFVLIFQQYLELHVFHLSVFKFDCYCWFQLFIELPFIFSSQFPLHTWTLWRSKPAFDFRAWIPGCSLPSVLNFSRNFLPRQMWIIGNNLGHFCLRTGKIKEPLRIILSTLFVSSVCGEWKIDP